jgi:hypothetical protein
MSVMFLINALGQYERDTGMSLEDVSVIVKKIKKIQKKNCDETLTRTMRQSFGIK